MQRKLRVTGFARFIIVMAIVTPLAYIGASYYNGEDGIANIKHLLGIDKTEAVDTNDDRFIPSREEAADLEGQDPEAMRKELEQQQKRLEELKRENARLRQEVNDKEEELSNLKNQ
ncbi:MAG: hypothetical protein H6563_06210 [Lewinellaceae bacterium]|nr:hypothetical protein [Lewinellaceae bacterium]